MAEKEFVDMDIFSRRIGPYFTWLESKIESGWKQSDSVKQDVLKETKALAQSMRARFILGITRSDFSEELDRAVGLFNLALDAFPDYSGEVEQKLQHFTKGINTEFGEDLIPNGAKVEEEVEAPVESPVENPEPEVKEKKVAKKKAAKKTAKKKAAKKAAKKKAAKKTTKKKAVKKSVKEEISEPVDEKPEVEEEVREQVKDRRPEVKKRGPVSRWFHRVIFGED